MTSKQRLMAAIQHKIPDRVPISTYDMTGWHYDPRDTLPVTNQLGDYIRKNITQTYLSGWWNEEPSYQPLMHYIREKADCIYMAKVSARNAYIDRNTRIEQWSEGSSTFTKFILTTPKGDLTQTFRVEENIRTAWQIEHRIKDDYDIERFLSIPFEPLPIDITNLKEQEKFLGENGIIMVDVSDPICEVFAQFDFGEYMIKAFHEPKVIKKMLDFVYERHEYFLKEMLEKGAGPLFRFSGAEACTPPYLPIECFKEFVTHYDKKLVRLIHDYGRYARIHSHGMVKTVLGEFLEMEADAIDPVEAPISGDVELWEAKKICGDKICIFGNIQLRDLEQLPAAEMRKVVEQCMEEGKPGGNFVALPTATPINVPLSPQTEENFRIFIDTALELGQY